MAYVPPHKRQLKDGEASSSLTPELPPETLIPRFRGNVDSTAKFYPKKWFVVGLVDKSRVSDLARLEPVAMHSFKLKFGETPLALVPKGGGEEASEFSPNPWVFIVESVKEDLISSFQRVKDEMRGDEVRYWKPTLVVRFGRILFLGKRWYTAESLRKMPKFFYTNIPPSYMEHITNNIVPEIGFEFQEKEIYYVEITDTKQPDRRPGLFKCYYAKGTNQLELSRDGLDNVLYEVDRRPRFVADMACLEKNLDLRLMLHSERILEALTNEVTDEVKILINSAILDPDVKGGLRWPLGEQSSGGHTVVGVSHRNVKTFKNSSMKLKIQREDEFDFSTSQGEVTTAVTLKMPGILSLLHKQTGNTDAALEMLRENMKLISRAEIYRFRRLLLQYYPPSWYVR